MGGVELYCSDIRSSNRLLQIATPEGVGERVRPSVSDGRRVRLISRHSTVRVVKKSSSRVNLDASRMMHSPFSKSLCAPERQWLRELLPLGTKLSHSQSPVALSAPESVYGASLARHPNQGCRNHHYHPDPMRRGHHLTHPIRAFTRWPSLLFGMSLLLLPERWPCLTSPLS